MHSTIIIVYERLTNKHKESKTSVAWRIHKNYVILPISDEYTNAIVI